MAQWPQRSTANADDVLCRNPVGNGSAAVLRRAALDAIAFWDEGLGRTCWFDESFRQSEDIECWTRIAATTAWQLALVPFVLVDYRVSAAGLSANTAKQLATWRRFRAKVTEYAPALNAAHGDLAEAYQLRYLARRAVQNGDGRVALQLMHEALVLGPRIVVQEPARTAVTYVAAMAGAAFPAALSTRVLSYAAALAAPRTRLAAR